jgi:uncharacterized protein (TIGR03435 family)
VNSVPSVPSSIRRNTSGDLNFGVEQRPDGGLVATNVVVATLIARAYPPAIPAEMVGLPAWARSDRYDITATSPLSNPSPEDRIAMVRALGWR